MAIGASAGGLSAFKALLEHVPVDTGLAFVLVQHLDPAHKSLLAELLSKATAMPVLQVAGDEQVRPNHVYVIPPNADLAVQDGRLRVLPRTKGAVRSLPIDVLFRSLAADCSGRAIAVVLSGSGSDGAQGMEEVKAAGGISIVQSPESAEHADMPLAAIATGVVDFVLDPPQIAAKLAELVKHRFFLDAAGEGDGEEDAAPSTDAPHAYRHILGMVHSLSGVDFGLYKETTIRRRVLRRSAIHARETLANYAAFLDEHPEEVEALYHDLLINVTGFFRDVEAFEALKTTVFPRILANKSSSDPVRVWVAGCSTGQEAYSLAIVLLEYLEGTPGRPAIQIFATDVLEPLIEKARVGIYPESIASEVSPERLRRFFTKEERGYRIAKSIRELCVFARQNLITDPPLSRMDLVTCRNVLIYMSRPLQDKLISLFHYALKPYGFLMVGHSETVTGNHDSFVLSDKAHRIYSRNPVVVGASREHFNTGRKAERALAVETASPRVPTAVEFQKEVDRIVLDRFAPASVLVNEKLEILQFRGETGPFLKLPRGQATFNLLDMARGGLSMELGIALRDAKKRNAVARRTGVRLREGVTRAERRIDIEVMPITLPDAPSKCFYVLFHDENAHSPSAAGEDPSRSHAGKRAPNGAGDELSQVKRELTAAQEYLATAAQEHSAATEELKSANEEILSSNEELQSTIEELQSSKEELQSGNEELTTLADELRTRNAELTLLNDDLGNVLASVRIPLLLVGHDLRIRRFNAEAGKSLKLVASDIGRPVAHLALLPDVQDLDGLLTGVMDEVVVREREARDRSGRWRALRIHPYRTSDNKIDGAVLALVDIDDLRQAHERIEATSQYAKAIVDTIRDPVLILSSELRVEGANRSFYAMFGLSPEATEGQLLFELNERHWRIPGLRQALESSLSSSASVVDLMVDFASPKAGARTMLLNARTLLQREGEPPRILLTIEDITERAGLQNGLRKSEVRYRRLFEAARDGILLVNPLTRKISDANPFVASLLRCSRDEVIGKELWELGLMKDEAASREAFRELKRNGFIRYDDLPLESKDGQHQDVEFVSNVYDEDGHEIIQCNIRDISDRKHADEELRRSVASERAARGEADRLNRLKDDFLATLSHELRTPLNAILGWAQILQKGLGENPPKDWAQGISVIERSARDQSQLIADLLDISAMQAGKLRLDVEAMDLKEPVLAALQTVHPAAEAKGVRVEKHLDSGRVLGDSTRLQQVVWNLLTNAVKFTPSGGSVRVQLRCEDNSIELAIVDTGRGIAPDFVPHLFERFRQADASSSRQARGLGLGLAIVKELVELHGGTVRAESAGEGRGTTVVVSLPRLAAGTETVPRSEPSQVPARRARKPSPMPAPSLSNVKVLVVDDEPEARIVIQRILEGCGAQVRLAGSTEEALAEIPRFRPDVLVSDIGMPGRDGYELLRSVRKLGAKRGGDVPALALTAYARVEDRAKALQAGFQAHAAKPIEAGEVLALVRQLAPMANDAAGGDLQ